MESCSSEPISIMVTPCQQHGPALRVSSTSALQGSEHGSHDVIGGYRGATIA